MRFYFDFKDGERMVPDEEGIELPDAAAAQEEAELSMCDLIEHIACARRDGDPLQSVAVCVRQYGRHLFHLTYTLDVERF